MLHDVMMTVLVDDATIQSRLSAPDAVRWMGEAIDAHYRGELIAPPRAHVQFADGRIVFTAGQLRGSWFGYRSYDTFESDFASQVVVVHDQTSGAARAVAIGNELGPRRTGAIGAVAADSLSPRHATVAAIIGTGTQARTQLWALATVRNLDEVRVFSRDQHRREAFAQQMTRLMQVKCQSASSARNAVEGAQIVILATNSATSVIDASWLERGAYVTTLGPKQLDRAEFSLDLAERASVLVTDSLDQLDAYEPPNILSGTPQRDRLVSLGAVRAGVVTPPGSHQISLFFSVGLAGTEVFLLDRLAQSLVG